MLSIVYYIVVLQATCILVLKVNNYLKDSL